MEPHLRARWEHYEHAPGVGVRGFGETQAEAFAQAALAATAAIVRPDSVKPWETVTIHCRAPSDDLLLDEWLNALVREMTERKMLFSRFAVRIDGELLTAEARGESVDPARHRLAVDLHRVSARAPRVNGTLPVAKHADGWVAQTVLHL